MSKRRDVLESDRRQAPLSRLGLVVHPTRAVDGALGELRAWATRHGVEMVQIRASCEQQRVAEEGDATATDLIVAIGGDGTTLAALHAGVSAVRPVLAAACGSLGVLTAVPGGRLVHAVERFARGDWTPRSLAALAVAHGSAPEALALNDVVVVRAHSEQLRLNVHVDGKLFARLAGDGCVASTPFGSSAYTLAAGGPLLAPEMDAYALTPLPSHGGSCPPLVVARDSVIVLEPQARRGEARLEIDGQPAGAPAGPLTIGFRSAVATLVGFPEQEPFFTVLRERRVIIDSPRILAEDARG